MGWAGRAAEAAVVSCTNMVPAAAAPDPASACFFFFQAASAKSAFLFFSGSGFGQCSLECLVQGQPQLWSHFGC